MVEALQYIGSVHEVLIDISRVRYLFLKKRSRILTQRVAVSRAHTHRVDPALEEECLLLQLTHNGCLQILLITRLVSGGHRNATPTSSRSRSTPFSTT